MAENTYGAADIHVLEFDEAVRARPGMYFGVGPEDPALATQVLCRVLDHALHPAARLARAHTASVHAEILGDLSFAVTDDQIGPVDEHGVPRRGYQDSLLGTDRWMLAAAAAVSSHSFVEIWQDGRGFRQELARLRPTSAPERCDAPSGGGTKATFHLDPAYVGHDAAITRDLNTLDLHGPHCTEPAGPGQVTIRDLRRGPDSTPSHYT